jgi:hypothetical protein
VATFYIARSEIITPLPWSTFALPFSRIAINLKDAGEAFHNVISILARSPLRIGKGDAGRGRAAPFQYINGFYNPRRRHLSLGGKSPLAFERKAA